MVGRLIKHKFEDEEGVFQWYQGTVGEYCSDTRTHRVSYENDPANYVFNLMFDLLAGDLELL